MGTRCNECGSRDLFLHGRCADFEYCNHKVHIAICNKCHAPVDVKRVEKSNAAQEGETNV
jgi:hypothetical protein